MLLKFNIILPHIFFFYLFMDVPSYLGANNIWKHLCEPFQRNTDLE